jgi:hypothetical protein
MMSKELSAFSGQPSANRITACRGLCTVSDHYQWVAGFR